MGPTRRASPTSRWPRPGPDSSPNLDLNPNLTRTLTRTLTLTLTQSLTIAHLKVAVTHPGIFCAFSSPEVEDTCSVPGQSYSSFVHGPGTTPPLPPPPFLDCLVYNTAGLPLIPLEVAITQ